MSRTEKWCSCQSRIPPCTLRTPWPASRWPRLYWHWRAAAQYTGPPRPWPPAPWPLPSSCRAGACQAQLTWVVTLPLPLKLTSQAQVQSPSQALYLNPSPYFLSAKLLPIQNWACKFEWTAFLHKVRAWTQISTARITAHQHHQQ